MHGAGGRSILLALTGPFYPPHHGDSVRIHELIRFLRARGWRVHVVQWHSADFPDADYAAMAEHCDGLSVYRDDGWEPPLGSEACDDWCPADLAELVGVVARERGVDVVLAQYAFMSRCLAGLPAGRTLRVLDADNVFTGRRQLFESAGFEYDWFSTTAGEERAALLRADLVLAVQEAEQAMFRRLAPERPVLLVPPAEPTLPTDGTESDEILFVSSADPPNEAGIRAFMTGAMPRIRRQHPAARLSIAGTVGRGLPEQPGVECLGVVPDLVPLYGRAAIVLNTTACGTGIKSKTVRALCHGKCLVSTPAGVQGLEAYPGVYRLATTPAEFADQIGGLLSDRASLRATAEQALTFARRYFDPDIVFGRLERALLDGLAARR